MKNKLTMFLVAMMASVLLAACGNGNNAADEEPNQNAEQPNGEAEQLEEVDPDEVIATVNGKEIKGEQYNSILPQAQMMMQFGQGGSAEEMKEQTLDMLINQELTNQEVADKGHEASEEEVNEYIAEIKANYEDDESFEEALAQNNLTMEQLEEQIAQGIALEKYIENEIPEAEVTDEQVQEYYEQAKAQNEAQQGQGQEGEENQFPELAEVEDRIREQLQMQEAERQLQAIIEELKEKSEIEKMI